MGNGTRAVTVVALLALATSARAESTLPTLALEPAPTPSIWTGLSIGTEVFGISGSHGVKGGFGGAVTAGYDREFANNIVLGVGGAVGYTPFAFTNSRARGFDFAQTDVRVGYDLGRLMPYVTGGVALLKPTLGTGLGAFNASDSFNDLVNGSRDLKAVGTVGAGVEYAITNNLHVDVAVSVTQTPALLP